MKKRIRTWVQVFTAGIPALVPALAIGLSTPQGARADAEDAKKLMKAMSDYMAAQKSISLEYDAILEIVTKEHQTIVLIRCSGFFGG